jgi:phosphoglycolate phosphatase-like HAD superfamily hydrolase
MKTLALDFDGVISDSAPEAFVVALRTYVALRPDSRLAARPECDSAPALAVLRADPLYRDFLGIMPLGNRAEDYAVAFSILEREIEIADQAAYDAQRGAQPPDLLEVFHRRFYQLRDHFSDTDPGGWQRLLGPYPAFVDVLRRRASNARLALATAKDRRSVRKLLRAYGIDDLFPEGSVLDKETGVSKRAHLTELQRRFDLAYRDITFVDDKVNHLDAVADLGVRCALAAWGYNGAREHALARRRGYLVCSLEDVEQQLFAGSLTPS